jgi:hypothetical protein
LSAFFAVYRSSVDLLRAVPGDIARASWERSARVVEFVFLKGQKIVVSDGLGQDRDFRESRAGRRAFQFRSCQLSALGANGVHNRVENHDALLRR